MKKGIAVLTAGMMIMSMITGCGGAARPDGDYSSGEVTLSFGDESVMVQEGDELITSDYEITEDGTITFELEGEEMTCTYDEEEDEISMYGRSYKKD